MMKISIKENILKAAMRGPEERQCRGTRNYSKSIVINKTAQEAMEHHVQSTGKKSV